MSLINKYLFKLIIKELSILNLYSLQIKNYSIIIIKINYLKTKKLMKFQSIQSHPNFKKIFELLNLIALKNLKTEDIIQILSEFESIGSKIEPNYQGDHGNNRGNYTNGYGNGYGSMGYNRIQNHNFKETKTNKSQFAVLKNLYYKEIPKVFSFLASFIL